VRRTVQEIADTLDTDKATADHLVKFLEAFGLVRFRGERPSPSGKGKGAYVYEVEEAAWKRAGEMIRRLE
jgi:predicted transcriptional regulator